MTGRDLEGWRVFLGSQTAQLNFDGKPARAALWYYEPPDYDGDVLWSGGFVTRAAAERGARLERLAGFTGKEAES